MSLPKATIDLKSMTAIIGNKIKGYTIVDVIEYEEEIEKREMECHGNGWYTPKNWVKIKVKRYALYKNNIKIGIVKRLYSNIKSDIYPI